jgi:mannosyltransferase
MIGPFAFIGHAYARWKLKKQIPLEMVELVAPNFPNSYSGVSSTLERVLKIQNEKISAATLGAKVSDAIPQISLFELPGLFQKPKNRPFRIWHARRNNEMFAGIVLKIIFRMPLRLVFTSASQRRHSTYTRLLIGLMDAVVAASEKSASYLPVKSVVILHGMNFDRFFPAENRSALRAKLGLPDKTLVGCFGRIRWNKGTDIFVDAMLRIMPGRPDVHAVICGLVKYRHRKYAERMKAKIDECGLTERFIWAGEVDSSIMPEFFRSLDLYVAPQRSEGFGVTPLEAMSSSVPVVATDSGTFTEQISPGKTGLIVPKDDVDRMVGAIEKMLSDRGWMTALGKAGRQRVIEQFPISKEAAALNEVYEMLWLQGQKSNYCLRES